MQQRKEVYIQAIPLHYHPNLAETATPSGFAHFAKLSKRELDKSCSSLLLCEAKLRLQRVTRTRCNDTCNKHYKENVHYQVFTYSYFYKKVITMPNNSRKTIFTTISIDKETAALVEKICKRYSLKKSEVVKLAFGYIDKAHINPSEAPESVKSELAKINKRTG